MQDTAHRAIAIVGLGAVLPDAPNVQAFWENVKNSRYSISEVRPDRWDPDFYYDPDPAAPDKTYSKIGGWVREFQWDPMKWRLPIPPRVVEGMDDAQKWGIACVREALEDYGYPKRPLDPDRTAVILGNAMAGERHYLTSFRVFFPEYARGLAESVSFAALPAAARDNITRELHERIGHRLPEITEDSMPGELANCIAGRIANLFNFHGPNFTCDAACASAMAAITSAVKGLVERDFDAVITGGIDRNMGAPTFVKFCKIGALSATGTRPYAHGADGFVMGEGAAIFLLKRLADAERDGDKVYAVLRGIGGSSDGKGKGITAPNPIGQKLCIERGWQNAGLSPATATLFEGHGTSTRVGDVVEAQSLVEVLAGSDVPKGSIALGSVKSNFGHLKGAAGAAGILKATLALHDKVLPPSLHCETPSPDIDFAHSPLYVNTELKPWTVPTDTPRRAAVSAFGFGGTNFHAVFEEFLPGKLNGNGKRQVTVPAPSPSAEESVGLVASSSAPVVQTSGSAVVASALTPAQQSDTGAVPSSSAGVSRKTPLRGALVIGAATQDELTTRLIAVQKEAAAGRAPAPAAPAESDLRAPERLAIDFANAADLADKSAKALKALKANQAPIWKALRAQGIFRGHGPAPKVAFLYTGQGSQYVNMLQPLRAAEPIVADLFAEADRIMTPLLGKPLSEFIFVDPANAEAVAKAEEDLRQTEITQPTVLTIDLALTRLLAAYGIQPDMTMGHSLGEYGALVASGSLTFENALQAVSARGRGMTQVAVKDTGKMAAVFAPLAEVERILKTIDGYVVIANVNSGQQSVIGGASKAVEQAMEIFMQAGYDIRPLPVSHAFHTWIVAPASEPLREMLSHLHIQPPQVPVVANVNGEFYPTGPDVVPQMLDLLAKQVASPVQFVKGLNTLYDAGARVFVEVGPKKALQGFAEEVLGDRGDVVSLFTNHPKVEDITAFNQALCGLYAAGLGCGQAEAKVEITTQGAVGQNEFVPTAKIAEPATTPLPSTTAVVPTNGNAYSELGRLVADALERSGWQLDRGQQSTSSLVPVTITGASLGLPGTERIFDDSNVERILRGDQFINLIPGRFLQAMLDKHIRRLVKSEKGEATFETITDVADVIKLAGRGGAFDLEAEFGVPSEHLAALDRVTRLAIGAGIDALRDAGIPLVMRYKTTTKGTQLPDRWGLPDAMRDDTGVIFGSAFPGYDSFVEIISSYFTDHARREQLGVLERLRVQATGNGHSGLGQELDRRIADLRATIEKEPYVFDRRFLLRVLSMGHSQFAELIGARGPNTQINAACASTAQAVALAEDWIRAGRCRRVIIISADDVTSDNMLEWFGPGFLASGAAATDEVVEDAAIPFDRRRHGLIVGMGAAALVIESVDAARERGIQPICEVLSAVTANSAFHGTRLDVQHIGQVMEDLVAQAEARSGVTRKEFAPQMVFVSHETYTPARGGSASAEIYALRRVFGDDADKIVIANTKGMTGHAMATGIEDVLAVKALETGLVPPVANFKEVDPELGVLNLSKGGAYPVQYAMHLGAGFGSQISMILLRWVPTRDGVRPKPNALGYAHRIADETAWSAWLSRMAGRPVGNLEVVCRTLRVPDQGLAARVATKQETSAAQVQCPRGQALQPPIPVTKPAPTSAVETQEAWTKSPSPQLPAPAPPLPAVKPKTEAKVTTAAPATSPTPAVTGDAVKERILALVVEKTGYPKDMLDLDLDLEADLGVDTVKQAEMFAAIREIYNIPRDENRKLRDYPTLAHVIRFVYEKRPDLASGPAPSTTPVDVTTAQPPVATEAKEGVEFSAAPTAVISSHGAGDEVKERILALVVEKTGYPKDMLDLDLDLEADLGVDTVKQAEMFAAIREIYNIPRDENRKLRDYPTLAHVIRFVFEQRPDLSAALSAHVISQPATAEPTSVAIQPAAQPPIVASTQVSGEDDSVEQRILSLVVEKTGYPKDMLDLDLDLEADLGVDTVKQAEMFAAIREIYNIPRDENRKLRDYPTLAHVIRFVYERRPDLAGPAALAPVPSQPTVSEPSPVTPTPAAPTPPPAAEVAVAAPTADAIKDQVLEIVAEKTGYPKDMLDFDLDLEADLGIDTVKQAEMFAAIRAAYNIPRDENLKLRDFPTLAHVIQFAQDKQRTAGTPAVTTAAPVAATPVRPRPPVASFEAANRVPRRVPVPTLRPPLSLCKSTGVTLGSGSRVVIMPDKGGVASALTQQLKAKGVEVLQIGDARDPVALAKTLTNWLAAGPVQGIYWLPALDDEGPISKMDLSAWHKALQVRVKSLYATMRVLYEQTAAPGTFLVSATRLGGMHGYDEAGATAPLGGAVTGFTKTYKRERPDTLVKALDFEAGRNPSEIAELLINETLRDPGAVEVGYKQGLRWTVGLREQSVTDGLAGLTLDENTVFLITGAAGSIVSAITADLAAASGGTFYLLDLVPEPDADNPDLKRFVTDKDGLKRELFARIQARGERATPALVEKELAALERAHAAQSAIDAVRAAGGTVQYFSVNLTDAEAVAEVINQVRQRSGRIDVLLHAAGIERSHFLPDKDPHEFDLIFDVKADGWFNLLSAIGDMPVKASVAFSSVAGRFGNAGQSDYSSANDLLCKITSSFRSTRLQTRGIVIDWSAWGGVGMATRGSIPKMMELAGIDMLPPEAGVPWIRRELTAGGTRTEVVVGQRLGVLLNEWDATGGLDVQALASEERLAAHGPMVGKITGMGIYSGLTMETTLDPASQPFLYDHRIDGTPVLPGVMGIEAFAETALCVHPGWYVEGVEEVNFLAPFKFYRDEPRTLTVQAMYYPQGDTLVADCRLIGRRTLMNQSEPQETAHFTARVRLTRKAAASVPAKPIITTSDSIVEAAEIYRVYFHGPAYQVVERAWWDGKRMVGLMAQDLPGNHQPSDQPTLMAPRLIELCFQTAGLWELGAQSRFGLPQDVQQVSLLRAPELAEGKLYAVVTPYPEDGTFDAEVVDAKGNRYLYLSGYRTSALPGNVDNETTKVLQAVMSGETALA